MSMPRILIVDDDREVRALLAEILAAEGLDDVVEAEDGQAGLELATAAAPMAVILDLGLPKLDGMEVLRRIRAFAPELPVIVLTSSADVRAAVEAMRLGAYDYVTKPFRNDELILHVRQALERRALCDEIHSLKDRLANLITPGHRAGLDAGERAGAGAAPGVPRPVPVTLREARDRGAAEAEQRAIRWALEAARGNKSEAARLLKTDYKTLHVKVRQYGIRAGDFRSLAPPP